MNDFQITNITIAKSNDNEAKGDLRKIGYTGTFSDNSHLEGFIMMSEDKFFTTNYANLKNIVVTQIIKNLGGKKDE
ncbi:hypothetical protein I6H67_04090 [Pediococcus pentosaceus]|uniref:hypothetical protein n=1 Tax=Pediococcus pentosaceus TaxID=1255 RepID=UPI0018E14DA0|nr:hypothetical protein [Pediococcus pentosaceus]MBF7104626.1 hypothetical protein [Pediococcus pentosaceus]QQC62038.1 hypothetical protein I6H67_04090 [Pediococcus pentosaceus]